MRERVIAIVVLVLSDIVLQLRLNRHHLLKREADRRGVEGVLRSRLVAVDGERYVVRGILVLVLRRHTTQSANSLPTPKPYSVEERRTDP